MTQPTISAERIEEMLAGLHARITAALATPPAPVDGGVRHAFRNADESDWQHLFAVLPDTGRGKFWQAVMKEARAALTAGRAAVAQDETDCPDCHRKILAEPAPARGFIAKCGRRLARIDQCGDGVGCTQDETP